MDNKQAKEVLEKVKIATSMNATPIISNEELQSSLEMAIKSLDMWDKVIKELEQEMNEYENVLSDLSYSDGVGYTLAVIEEHLKEIEE